MTVYPTPDLNVALSIPFTIFPIKAGVSLCSGLILGRFGDDGLLPLKSPIAPILFLKKVGRRDAGCGASEARIA